MSDFAVEMRNISKNFPGVRALDHVSIELRKGEVMALLGENGAGKSTLMKILSGIHQPDEGKIFIDGSEVFRLNPTSARQKGIAIIHQELNICRHLTVAENIFLGREIRKFGTVLDNSAMNRAAAELMDRLCMPISPTEILSCLPVSKQQMIEIAKALSLNARVLIMDEPTSALTSKEIDDLFRIIRQLKEDGCAIVYISHRLEELKHITDRITVMRDSHYITSGLFNDFTMDEIISHMVGRKITEKFPRVSCPAGKTILEVRNLTAGKQVRDISFSVKEGEILGFAGLMGAGRTEMTRAVFGIDKKESGQILLDGKEINIRTPRDAIDNGIVLAPEDRKKDGLCIKLSVADNIVLPNLKSISNKLGVISHSKEQKMIKKAIKKLKIKVHHPLTAAQNLSGGNQQKVVVAKWLSGKSRVVMFDEPTRGIDVAAKVEIYNLMNDLKKQGIGVLFVSSELPEVLGVADRILVMCDGKITGELSREEASQEKIMHLATQFDQKIK